MTSQSVLAAQPKSKTKALENTASPSRDEMPRRLSGYEQNLPDRFSIRGHDAKLFCRCQLPPVETGGRRLHLASLCAPGVRSEVVLEDETWLSVLK